MFKGASMIIESIRGLYNSLFKIRERTLEIKHSRFV